MPSVGDFRSQRAQAIDLLTSDNVAAAFDLRRETDRLRDRYGRNLFGQSLLMGRRMIEAGVRKVGELSGMEVERDDFEQPQYQQQLH